MLFARTNPRLNPKHKHKHKDQLTLNAASIWEFLAAITQIRYIMVKWLLAIKMNYDISHGKSSLT